jgi:MFS family permease
MSASASSAVSHPSANAITLRIFSVVLLTFICYLSIGIPLAVLPGYIHGDLGYGSFIAGLGISVQYIATLLSRPYAGRSADSVGPKQTVQFGMLLCIGSGVFLLLAALARHMPVPSLLLLVASRMTLGVAESLVGTGSISWGIGRVGAGHTARIISWNGIASYSALAIGAPLGVAMAQHWGFIALGAVAVVMPVIGYLIARAKSATAVVAHGETMAFRHVLRRVLSSGIALGLGTVGFGSIATFITLYYASFGWADAAYCLSAFGAAFIGARLLFSQIIRRFGGFRVALVFYPIEFVGLLMIWLAPSPLWAVLGAALTGFGFSMIFPALAVEAVALVPLRNRGAAIGAYTLFLDISLGITGPLAGLIIGQFGYPSVYLFAALSTLLATLIVIRSHVRAAPNRGE